MKRPRVAVAAVAVASSRSLQTAAAYVDAKAASGARVWVDPETTGEAFTYQSSRGDKWELVMSDEFNKPGRSFLPGNDHLWTAIEAPDGNDKALEYYAANLATTECEGVVCYLKLQAQNLPRTTSVWVQDATPPGMKNVTLNYQSAMLQSWNKFCFQGGMVEVRAKLPGAVGATSKNPDLARGALSQVQSTAFYPTWPGIWLMGNLGRVLFRDSTTRMWPFSYNECDDELSKNQRISACDKNPGSGMNANQGRGAPEIDILQGGGLDITASLQIGPGMPAKFRRIHGETPDCVFGLKCRTLGANSVGVPTEAYAARGYKSWYQGLRYAFNPFCAKNETLGGQSLAKIQASLQAGITANKCDISVCPASLDVNSDLGPLLGSTITTTTNKNWGINTDGSCFAYMSTYEGALLCSPGNPDPECVKQAGNAQAASSGGDKFNYYADAVSANWPIHLAMYTDFLAYQVEWVPGKDGYIRWMLERQPLFEIPAAAINNPPQDDGKKNPTKILPEEPMYIIMNVALSSSWSAQPPNAPRACRDHGSVSDTTKIAQSELICDQFPLDMKIDYVRVYQDMSSSSKMSVGCDPASHPTRQWIKDHIKDYQNAANPMIQVAGKAACITNADCTVTGAASGTCQNGRCQCLSKKWAGPRCTSVWSDDGAGPVGSDSGPDTTPAFGTTKLTEVFGIGFAALIGLVIVVYIGKKIRMWLYYRSQPELDHTVINPENPDTARHSEYAGPAQARWWEQSVNRGGTGAGAAAGAPGGASRGRGADGLAAIPESPTFGATAASAA